MSMYKFKRSGIFLTTTGGADTVSLKVCETPGVLENTIARCRLDHANKCLTSSREKNDIVTCEGFVEDAEEGTVEDAEEGSIEDAEEGTVEDAEEDIKSEFAEVVIVGKIDSLEFDEAMRTRKGRRFTHF